MSNNPILPPEFDSLLIELAGQTPAVHELFQYGLTLMMIDDEKAVELGRCQVDGREWLQVRLPPRFRLLLAN